MATRYIVTNGPTNVTSTFSASSGGAPGASVPVAGDLVIADTNTPAGAGVSGAAMTCGLLDYSAYPTVFAFNQALTAYGIKGNGISPTGGGYFYTFNPPNDNGGVGWDIDLGGTAAWPSGSASTWVINAPLGRLELRRDLNLGTTTTLRRTSHLQFNTNNYAITAAALSIPAGAAVKGGSAGTSVITLTSGNTAHTSSGTNDTWDTSNATYDIRATANAPSWPTGAAIGEIRSSSPGMIHIGAPTGAIGTLRRTGTAVQTDGFYIGGNLTVGNLVPAGNSPTNSLLIASSLAGATRTITLTNTPTPVNTDFMDINGAGAASWNFSAINTVGDRGGNTGITFIAKRVLQRNGVAGNMSDKASWVGATYDVLPHDDLIFNGSNANTTFNKFAMGAGMDWTGYGGVQARPSSTTPYSWYGDWIYPVGGVNQGVVPNTFYMEARGRKAGGNTITTNGVIFCPSTSNQRIDTIAPGIGTGYTFNDGITYKNTGLTQGPITCAGGLLDMGAGLVHELGQLGATGAAVRTLNVNTATINFFSASTATILNLAGTNVTFQGSQATYNITGASASARTFTCAGQLLGRINYTVDNSPGPIVFSVGCFVDTLNLGPGRGYRSAAGAEVRPRQIIGGGGADFGGQKMGPGMDGSNLVSQPNSAQLQITGDITLDFELTAGDWTPSGRHGLAGMINAALTTGYAVRLNTTGTVEAIFAGVTNGQQSCPTPTGFTDLTRGFLRVQRAAATGAITMYSSLDGINWTQLGVTTSSNPGPLIANTTDSFNVGCRGAANDLMPSGIMHRVVVYNILMGTAAIGAAPSANIKTDQQYRNKPALADSFTESSPHAATVSIGANIRNNDGRLTIDSSTAGTPTWLAPLERPVWDRVKAKDVACTHAGKLYVGASGVVDTGCSLVNTGAFDPTDPYIRQYIDGGSFAFPPIAGNKIVGAVTPTGGSPVWSTPAGYTVIRKNAAVAPSQIETYERIADGSETGFTTTTTGGAIGVKAWEVVGADTIDVNGENSGSAVTNVNASAAPLTTYSGGKTLGIGIWAGNAFGASGAMTDGYGESRLPTLSSHLRAGTRVLPASTSTNPNFAWTGNQNPRAQLLVLKASAPVVSPFVPHAVLA